MSLQRDGVDRDRVRVGSLPVVTAMLTWYHWRQATIASVHDWLVTGLHSPTDPSTIYNRAWGVPPRSA